MFADQFISEAIEEKPQYYDGETREDLRVAHEQAIASEWNLYNRFIEAINKGEN